MRTLPRIEDKSESAVFNNDKNSEHNCDNVDHEIQNNSNNNGGEYTETCGFEDFINPPVLLTSPFESENTNSSLDDTIDSLSTLELKEVGFTKKRLRNVLNCEQLSTNFFEMISSSLVTVYWELRKKCGSIAL